MHGPKSQIVNARHLQDGYQGQSDLRGGTVASRGICGRFTLEAWVARILIQLLLGLVCELIRLAQRPLVVHAENIVSRDPWDEPTVP